MNTPKNSFGRSSNDALSLPALRGGVSRAKAMRTPKFDKDYCRQIAKASEGISFVCYKPEEDAYFFQSGDYRNGFYEYRLLEQDMTEENARFMFEKGLSNTNKSSNL